MRHQEEFAPWQLVVRHETQKLFQDRGGNGGDGRAAGHGAPGACGRRRAGLRPAHAKLCALLCRSPDAARVLRAPRRQHHTGAVARIELAADRMGSTARATRSRRFLGRGAHGAAGCGFGREGAVPADVGFAAPISMSGVVPGCQVRHLESLEPAVRAGRRGLVRAQHVHSGRADIRLADRAVRVSPDALRPSLAVRLQGSLRAMDAPQLAARGADGSVRACRSEAVRGARQSS